MPADAPRATADDRLPPGGGPNERPAEGASDPGGGSPASPEGDAAWTPADVAGAPAGGSPSGDTWAAPTSAPSPGDPPAGVGGAPSGDTWAAPSPSAASPSGASPSGASPSGDTWSAPTAAPSGASPADAPSGDTWSPASDSLGDADGDPSLDLDGAPEPASTYTPAPTGTAYGAELARYGRGSSASDSAASPNGANGGLPPAGGEQQPGGDSVPAAPPMKDDATVADGTAVIPPAPAIDPAASPAHLPGGPGAPGAPTPGVGGLPIRLPRLPAFRRRGEHDSARQRGKGLRVRQRLWNVDPWSVFKVSALFYLCLFFILLVAGTLLWNIGRSSGTIDQFESFVTRLGAYGSCAVEADLPDGTDFENDDDCPDGEVLIDGFELDDGTIFRASAIGGVILVLTGSVGNVLMTVLLNLINEVTGGTRYTIIKEPTPRAPAGSGAPGGAGGPPPDGERRSPRVRVRR